jgi:hypothetical protein
MIFYFEMKIQPVPNKNEEKKPKTLVIRLTKFELLSKWSHNFV